jgi:hypothetical protein
VPSFRFCFPPTSRQQVSRQCQLLISAFRTCSRTQTSSSAPFPPNIPRLYTAISSLPSVLEGQPCFFSLPRLYLKSHFSPPSAIVMVRTNPMPNALLTVKSILHGYSVSSSAPCAQRNFFYCTLRDGRANIEFRVVTFNKALSPNKR